MKTIKYVGLGRILIVGCALNPLTPHVTKWQPCY